MVVLPDGAYCGIAPVPGGRVNIGIVLGGSGLADAAGGDGRGGDRRRGAAGTDPAAPRRPGGVARRGAATDAIAGASPLGQPRRAPGRAAAGSWSATPPGSSTRSRARGSTGRSSRPGWPRTRSTPTCAAGRRATASPPTSGRCAARFASKDLVSRLVLSFLARPPLFERAARHLAERDDIRATMGLVMGDLVPASRALDPRFLAGLLGP